MKIGIVYGTVSSNLGDLAINYGLTELLRRLAPDAEVHVVFRNPHKAYFNAARASFEGLERLSFGVLSTKDTRGADIPRDYAELTRAVEYALEPARFIADAGLGGCDLVLCSSGEHLFAYENNNNHIDLVWHTLPALAAKAAGMRFAMLPATVGPFEAPTVAHMLRAFFTLNDTVALRESNSLKYAAQFLEVNPPVLLDPAFFSPVPQQPSRNDEAILGLVMRLENFGMRVGAIYNSKKHFANYEERGFGDSLSFRFTLAAASSFVNEVGGKVNLFIQTLADRDLALAVAKALNEQGYGDKVRVVQPVSVSEYQKELGRVSFIVASRFHACILGLLSSKPALGVHFDEHGHKMPGLFDLLGVPDYCLNVSGASPEVLGASVVPLFLERGRAFAEMSRWLRAKQDDTLAWLKQVLTLQNPVIPPKDIPASTLSYISVIEAVRSRTEDAARSGETVRLKADIAKLAAELKATKEQSEQRKADIFKRAVELKATREQRKADIAKLAAELKATREQSEQRKADIAKLAAELKATREQRKADIAKLAAELKATREQSEQRKAELTREKRENQAIGNSFSFRLGFLLVQALHHPGLHTIMLPYHLLQLLAGKASMRVRKRSKGEDKRENAVAQRKAQHEIKLMGDRLLRDGNFSAWIGLADQYKGNAYVKTRAPFVQANYRLLQSGFQPEPIDIPENYCPSSNVVFYLLHNSLPHSSGGYAVRTHGLLKALVSDGWHMHGVTRLGFPVDMIKTGTKHSLYTPLVSDAKGVLPADSIDGVQYMRLFDGNQGRYTLPLDAYLQAYLRNVLSLCEKCQPALLHGASFHWNGIVATTAARILGLPSIYEVRGLWELTRMSREPEWENSEDYCLQVCLETDACKQADAVITLTNGLKKLLIERGVSGDKILVVPNSVDTGRFVPRPRDKELEAQLGFAGKKVIGFIGAFAEYEGLEYLLQATAKLRAGGRDDLHIMLVGDGAVYDKLQSMCDELQIRDIVTFTGRVPHEDVERYYSLIDIVPYSRIGTPVCEIVSPLKPFEAMSMGKTVVASDVAALAEIVTDGETGLLHKKDDVDHLAHTLEILLENTGLMLRLGKAAREWVVHNRDWRITANSVSELYRQLMKGQRIAMPFRTTIDENGASIGHYGIYRGLEIGDHHSVTAVAGKFARPAKGMSPSRLSFTEVKLKDMALNPNTSMIKGRYVDHYGVSGIRQGVYPIDDWKRIEHVSSLLPGGKRFLDIGAGYCHFINLVASLHRFDNLTGVDIKRKGNFILPGVPSFNFVCASAVSLPFRDKSFDVVTCMEVLEHLDKQSFITALHELRRVTSRLIIVSVPYNQSEPLPSYHKLRFTDKDLLTYFPDGDFTLLKKSKGTSWMVIMERAYEVW
ncbi:glycosyltransferase [Chloroflexota bacterium]